MKRGGMGMEEKFSGINTALDVRSMLLFADLQSDDSERLKQRILAGFEVALIKQNPKRKVFRLSCPDGTELYLKLFVHRGILSGPFRFYAFREYRTARYLESLGLPMIHYLAWGRFRGGGFCLSEGIRAAVQARRYFFETLRGRPELRKPFLEQLAALTGQMLRSRVRHPDFHLGNILFSGDSKRLYLADPWGVRRTFFRHEHDQVHLTLPWLEMSGSLPEEEQLAGMVEAGLASGPVSARILLERAGCEYELRRKKHWAKLSARILSGKSKFATGVDTPEGRYFFRHTEWFEPPAELRLNPCWRAESFPTEREAREIWLNSFLKIPPVKNPPIAWLIARTGSSVLFYDDRNQ